jgi:NAD(P)-dependent dehydrogenase (short-subunit alcohol dehydrogenase family)
MLASLGVCAIRVQTYSRHCWLTEPRHLSWLDGMLHKMTDQQWQIMLDVHNTAPFRLIRAAAPYMREAAKKEIDQGQQPENRSIINVCPHTHTLTTFDQAHIGGLLNTTTIVDFVDIGIAW